MDTLDGMRTLIAVVREESFSGAARHLGMSPQLVSKYVARLEEQLGVRLLNRSTRRLNLTEAGRAYADRCRQILADVDELESAVGEMTTRARGTLRINGPMAFGVTHLAPAIAAYQAKHPDVDVEFVMNDHIVDILAEGFDLAIRIGRLEESALVARYLAPVRLMVCASPGYLARKGTPVTPRDLLAHDCLVYSYYSTRADWTFLRDGKTYTVHVSGHLVANNGDALKAAAVAGAGIILVPDFIAGDALAAGRLQIVLDDYEIPDVGIYAVYAHRQYLSAKVRTFVDFLAGYFGDPPYWVSPPEPSLTAAGSD
jgi:DNA-binding transcriptional LysR family regulator